MALIVIASRMGWFYWLFKSILTLRKKIALRKLRVEEQQSIKQQSKT
jgi:hypothetical protein